MNDFRLFINEIIKDDNILKMMEFIIAIITLISIVVSIVSAIWKSIKKSYQYKDKVIKTSELSNTYGYTALVLYLATVFIFLICSTIFLLTVYFISPADVRVYEFIIYIYKIVVMILNILVTLIIIKKKNLINILRKEIKKYKPIYYFVFFCYPVFGTCIAFTLTVNGVFEKTAKLLMTLMSINLFLGLILFNKFKSYKRYKGVNIVFIDNSISYVEYDKLILSSNFVGQKEMDDRNRKVKEIIYNKNNIKELEYIVDQSIDDEFSKYLKRFFG